MIRLKFKMIFLNLLINVSFYNFFITFLWLFYIYIKLSTNLSAKYYQENKGRLQTKLVIDMKIFPKRRKKKSKNMGITKFSQKRKNKRLLSIEKNIIEWEKMSYLTYEKVF